MKSNVIYSLCLSCIVIMASCNKDEDFSMPLNPSEYITFGQPNIRLSSRAALSSFPDGGQFQVLGYLKSYEFSETGINSDNLDDNSVSNSWAIKEVITPPSVFGGDKVNTTGATITYKDGYCTYDNISNLTLWHDNTSALYSFYYYYPANGNYFSTDFNEFGTYGSNIIVGLPNLTYTMPFKDGSSSTVLEMESIPDVMYGFSSDVDRNVGFVIPRFQHLLSGLKVRVNNYSSTNDVTVKSIRIYSSNFRRDITLNSDFSQTIGSQTFGGSFQFIDDVNGITVPSSNQEETGNSSEINKTLLLVPYTSNSDGIYFGDDTKIEIIYDFISSGTIKTNDLAFGLTMESGTIYTLQLNFVGDDLVLDFFAEQQWEDGNTVPEGNPGSNGNITFE